MKITDLQKRALLEAGNIGSGHAAIALSQLMGHKIMIAIPSIEFVDWRKVIPATNGTPFVQISIEIKNDAKGVMIFIINERGALKLCDVVMGVPLGSTREIGEIETSALKEIGSILSLSYLNAVSNMTGLSLAGSVPEMDIRPMKGIAEILQRKKLNIEDIKEIICVKTEFIEASHKIDAELLFASTEEDTQKILKSLGV